MIQYKWWCPNLALSLEMNVLVHNLLVWGLEIIAIVGNTIDMWGSNFINGKNNLTIWKEIHNIIIWTFIHCVF
jgi:hypothetical protein